MDTVNSNIQTEKKQKLLSLKDLLELIKPVRGRMVIACTLQTISAIASIVPFIAVAELANVLLQEGPVYRASAWNACWLAFFALIVRMATTYTAFYISHNADNDFQLIIRRKMAKHLVKVPLGWFTNRSAGDVKKGMADDVMHIHYLIAHAALEMLTAFVIPLITIVYLITINWLLALVALFPIAIGILMYVRTLKKGLGAMDNYTESMGKINGASIEFVQGILFTPLLALVTLTSASILAVQSGIIEPVSIVPFTLLGLGIAAPLLAMWYGGMALQEATVAATKVKALLETPVLEEVSSTKKINGLDLEFRNVSFSYDNKTNALQHINMILKPGTTTALVGRSGSGKSTVAKLIPRFWDPASGEILLGGVNIKEIPSSTLYQHISFVFQEVQMLSATVRENITLAKPDATEEEILKATKAANIHNRIMELPQGYDSIVGKDALFSGGEAQRLSIARALLADTPILVMDEATAFADPESEALIQDALSNLAVGRTLLVIAHRLSTIQYADNILVLDKGEIIEQGTHGQLLQKDGKYAGLWQRHERSSEWFPETRINTNDNSTATIINQ